MSEAPYNGNHAVLLGPANTYAGDIQRVVSAPNTGTWYQTQYGCLKSDPTLIARRHTFPDAAIPRGMPEDPGAAGRICLEYRNAWPAEIADAAAMVDVERDHPQFAFRAGGPGTVYQIDVESQLRRLDQPLVGGGCQAVLPADAPLYRNTVAPPPARNVPVGPQNAANPIAAILLPGNESPCRAAADQVATGMSGRWIHNATRQDTMQFAKPFSPPGIGSDSSKWKSQ